MFLNVPLFLGFGCFCLFGCCLFGFALGFWGSLVFLFVCVYSFVLLFLRWGMLPCKDKIQQNEFCILWLQLHLRESAQLVSCCSFSFSSGFLTTYPSEGPVLAPTAIELHWQSILHATERCSKLSLVTSAEYQLWEKGFSCIFMTSLQWKRNAVNHVLVHPLRKLVRWCKDCSCCYARVECTNNSWHTVLKFHIKSGEMIQGSGGKD